MSAPPADGTTQQSSSELRLAATFTGGVSLAVWMGGMAREMNLLLAASRGRHHPESVAPTTDHATRVRGLYGDLLELLDLDCTMDVLSGTSAGGINAVILGLANVLGFDLDELRDLWFDEGSLAKLLRDPADMQTPPSLLYGDKVLLQGLTTALNDLAGRWTGPAPQDQGPTQVFITTTLLSGEASTFTDAYGNLVRDIDHHGLFTFTNGQLTKQNVPALALAARCSASFPVAFEPGLIPIGSNGGADHPNMQHFTTAQVTQFAADGGLLANQPLGPALQAVFDLPADRDVRRVLAFVVPVLGGDGLTASKPTLAETPDLAAALRADISAMLSQTISGDLATITAHNQQVRARIDARQQLARLGMRMQKLARLAAEMQQVAPDDPQMQELERLGMQTQDRLGESFWDSYRMQRTSSVARTAADEVMRRAITGPRATDDRPVGFGADAGQVLAAAHDAAKDAFPSQLPAVRDYDWPHEMNAEDRPHGMNAVGREALDDGKATVLAIISRAFQLVPAEKMHKLGELRNQATAAMPDRHYQTNADVVRCALHRAPQTPGVATDEARVDSAKTAAKVAAQALLSANMPTAPPHPAKPADPAEPADAADAAHPADIAEPADPPVQPWKKLGTVVVDLNDLIRKRSDPARNGDAAGNGAAQSDLDQAGSDAIFVWDLLDYLTGPLTGLPDVDRPDAAAARLFDLHVARYVMQPDDLVADQELELVAMTSDTRTCLDTRSLAREKLTGLQLNHFGAFYKASWRANDWMWGRLDGAGWLVHVLLDPLRLHRLATQDPGFPARLQDGLEQIAGSKTPPGAAAEMEFLTAAIPSALPTSLPVTAMWVAAGLQQIIAAEELVHVAQQIDKDKKDHAVEAATRGFVNAYRDATGGAKVQNPVVPDAAAAGLLKVCRVSDEKFKSELGSGLFAQTVTQAAAVSVKAVGTPKALPGLRPVLAGARTVTSLAYRVVSVGPAAQFPLFAGLALLALGVLASTSTIKLLSGVGLAAVLAGLLLIGVGAARVIVLTVTTIVVAAGAVLAAAGYIPFVGDYVFPWLKNHAVPDLAKHPGYWAILVLFVLLPPLSLILGIIMRLLAPIINWVLAPIKRVLSPITERVLVPIKRVLAPMRRVLSPNKRVLTPEPVTTTSSVAPVVPGTGPG